MPSFCLSRRRNPGVLGKPPEFRHLMSIVRKPMTAPLKSIEGTGDLAAVMGAIGRNARVAARTLALASAEQKSRALSAMAAAVRAQKAQILAANAEDLNEARASGLSGAFLDRLA